MVMETEALVFGAGAKRRLESMGGLILTIYFEDVSSNVRLVISHYLHGKG